MRTCENQDAPGVIAGIFSLYDIKMHALIDPGSTHFDVCTKHLFDKMPSIEKLEYDMHVTSPLGHNVRLIECMRTILLLSMIESSLLI